MNERVAGRVGRVVSGRRDPRLCILSFWTVPRANIGIVQGVQDIAYHFARLGAALPAPSQSSHGNPAESPFLDLDVRLGAPLGLKGQQY